ncbi:PLDc_N domain-containing protein [Echinicola sp. CAU 1574]|uniref:PLDc_N domain-containing protein n=1 Tax=Echinicola arenosa TaxID=2774144 RepID=A0ABR9AHV6_9BACT|nr:PLD nuclease N-terminal domain-containing protein [Echinicola arenosa]MBD8488427.1 PLDc_N domain-containing protein [Echinicola arenosa]
MMKIILLFTLIPLALMVWALVDVLTAEFADSNTKLIWVIVILLLPFLGSILYLLIGRKEKTRTF